jgi:hypothetical protein
MLELRKTLLVRQANSGTPGSDFGGDAIRSKRVHKGKVRQVAALVSVSVCAARGSCLMGASCAEMVGVWSVYQAPVRYEDSLPGTPKADKRPRTAKKFADDDL